ncbi:anoctamin-4-like [Hyposmocoma kahamanoa]|uniref:anoctamin-4-like n=1 Tax=Hyposmocoma kahamanoa TaxID=1477025 RepID=UPI000E6D673E|nr:anoctamin-4-like [Hyposmocoma kahamanoa]
MFGASVREQQSKSSIVIVSSSSEKPKSVDSTITQQPTNELIKLDVEPITIDDEQIKPVETDQEPIRLYVEQVNTNPQPIEPDTISATKSVEEETASFFTKDPDGKTIKFVQNELVDYRERVQTGYFRDQKRRIDLIIVVDPTRDKDIERAKETFFRNCMNSGLEMELETGILMKNEDLVFVKVHAPNSVILALARHFGARKYFKNNHIEIMKETVQDERNLLHVIRRNYPGPFSYSTIDRIYLVYRLMRMMPFGTAPNYHGIDLLVERGIIRDVYALHDGPYYTVEQPDDVLTGRQALFETWVGSENVLKPQPLNLIREYLGERIAFLFGFFELYNKALILHFLFGLALLVGGLYTRSHKHINHAACSNQSYKYTKLIVEPGAINNRIIFTKLVTAFPYYTMKDANYLCTKSPNYLPCPYNAQVVSYYGWGYYNSFRWIGTLSREPKLGYKERRYEELPICPKCNDFKACPFVNMTKYCQEVKIKNLIDNPLGIYVIVFAVLWCLILALKWRQKEHYYYWLWEVREDDMLTTRRPEFNVMKHYEKIMKYGAKAMVISFMLLLQLLVVVPILVTYLHKTTKQLAFLYSNQEAMIRGSYIILAMSAALNGFSMTALEKVYTKISFHLNRMMGNQRTEKPYEMSVTIMLFSFSVLVNFSFIFYIAFLKGALYTYPSDEKRWYLPLGLGTNNCGMLSCIDELFFVFFFTHLCKKCFIEFDNMFQTHSTDMAHNLWHNQHVPCWEKEFDLGKISEVFIMNKYNYLMVQIALVNFFAFIFPIGGILAYITNFFEIR